jgi:hypothetical protein
MYYGLADFGTNQLGAGFSSTATLGCVVFSIMNSARMDERGETPHSQEWL